jgi:hypothetical protein
MARFATSAGATLRAKSGFVVVTVGVANVLLGTFFALLFLNAGERIGGQSSVERLFFYIDSSQNT